MFYVKYEVVKVEGQSL